MKNLSRSERRFNSARVKNNRKNYYHYGTSYGKEGIARMPRTQLGKVSQYPCQCSCPMCGNPRKNFGAITCKEKAHILDLKAYLLGCSDGMI